MKRLLFLLPLFLVACVTEPLTPDTPVRLSQPRQLVGMSLDARTSNLGRKLTRAELIERMNFAPHLLRAEQWMHSDDWRATDEKVRALFLEHARKPYVDNLKLTVSANMLRRYFSDGDLTPIEAQVATFYADAMLAYEDVRSADLNVAVAALEAYWPEEKFESAQEKLEAASGERVRPPTAAATDPNVARNHENGQREYRESLNRLSQ